MRPLYESPDDLEREVELASMVAPIWKCEFRKMPIQYKIDFALERNGLIRAFCEIKIRNYSMAQIDSMGGYKLSLAKFLSGESLAKQTGLPFVLLIGTTDGIWHRTRKTIDPLPMAISMWGRGDRNDPQDYEPCIVIPTKEFVRV